MTNYLGNTIRILKNPKILYFHSVQSSFVRKDLALLEENFDTKIFFFDPKIKILLPIQFLKQLIFLLINIRNSSMIITQFGGYQSFLPSFFGKLFSVPSLIILGGSDCVSFPSIKYGNFNKKLLGLFTKWSYGLATHLSPVHSSLVKGEYTYTDDDYPIQGYLNFCPKVKADYTELCYGYDHEFFSFKKDKIANSFLTVGYLNHPNYYRKGIDLIFSLAKKKNESTFTIVGGNLKDIPIDDIPENVTMIKSVSPEKLIDLYGSHEFYLQLSICEGFPSAICEAMLCGSIPIGSDVAAIPQIIGESGFVLKKKDEGLLLKLVDKAINCDKEEMAKSAREQIIKNYPINEREKLITLINKLRK